MKSHFLKFVVLILFACVLGGCGEEDEAKKLGFDSVAEMKDIQSQGWHTKAKYMEDKAIQDKAASEQKQDKATLEQAAAPETETVNKSNEALYDSIYTKAADEVCGSQTNAAEIDAFLELSNVKNSGGGLVSYCSGIVDKVNEMEKKSAGKNHESYVDLPPIVQYFGKCDKISSDKVKDRFSAGSNRITVCATIDKDKAYCQRMVNACSTLLEPILMRFNKAAEEFKSLKQSTATISPTDKATFGPLKRDTEYSYYRDGSCTPTNFRVCLTEDQYQSICKQVKGYTKRMIDMQTAINEKGREMFSAGSVGAFTSVWNGNSCQGSISASGIYKGTSARSTISGQVISFVYDGTDILAGSIDGFMQ